MADSKLMTPRAPESAISSKAKKQNRIRLLKESMPLLGNDLTQVVLQKLKEFDDWDSDSEGESVTVAQSLNSCNHLGYSHSRSIALQKKKVQMRVPKTLKGKSTSVYHEQCHRQRESNRKDMLEKAMRFVIASEKSQQRQNEMLLLSEISNRATSAAQGALRMATGRVKKWIKHGVDAIVKSEMQKYEAKCQQYESKLQAKKSIYDAWKKYRIRCHVAAIRQYGANSLLEKVQEEENETYAYRIRIAKRRALEDEEVREYRARRHADMLRAEQLRIQHIKSNVGSPRTPGGTRVSHVGTAPRARRFKDASTLNSAQALGMSEVCSPSMSKNSSKQVLMKGSDAFDAPDGGHVNVSIWKDKTFQSPSMTFSGGEIAELNDKSRISNVSYHNSLDVTPCTISAYPSAYNSSFVTSFSKALCTNYAANAVLRSGLKGQSIGVCGIGNVNEVASLCTDVSNRQECSSIFGTQAYSTADDERIFHLSETSKRTKDDPLLLFKQNIDEQILKLVNGEFQYTDEYYYGQNAITNYQAKEKIEKSMREGALLIDEAKVVEKIDKIKKTLGKQRKALIRKPGSAGKKPKSANKPGSAGKPRSANKPGSAGKPTSASKPGSRGRIINSANRKSRPSSMKQRREKETVEQNLFEQECEATMDLKEDAPISLAKRMLQEYA